LHLIYGKYGVFLPYRASMPTKVFQFIRMRSIVVDAIA
jgi:hypothetical protein